MRDVRPFGDGSGVVASAVDYEAVLNALGQAGIVTTPAGLVVAWNRAAEALYGWSAEQVVGRNIGEVTVAPWDAATAEAVMEQLRRGETWSGEFPVRRKDSSTFIAHVTDSPVFDDTGTLVAIVGISYDVTDRRRREDSLVRKQERVELIFDAARMGSWTLDGASGVIEWDAALEALFGLEPGSFEGTFDSFLALVHPDDREALAIAVRAERGPDAELRFEHRVVWPDGSVHWIEYRGRGVLDPDGTPIGMVGVGINIDDRKHVEAIEREAASLRSTANLAAQLQDAERIAKLGSWYWDARANVVTLSYEMATLLATGERLTGQEFRAALERISHPEDAAILYEAPMRALESHDPFVLEQRMVFGDEERLVVHRGEIDLDNDETVLGLRGTTQDITEERRAEERLLATTERLAQERKAVVVLREALIRPEFPVVAGYDLAARYLAAEHHPEIGGDWYDAFLVPDGRLMLTIGDLSGHGIVAARFMAKLRHAARAYACLDPDPVAVLARLDKFLHHFSPDDFATVQVALVTPATGHVTLASAGHPPPLHHRPDGPTYVKTNGTPPVGVFNAQTSPTRTGIEMEPGEALLFFTDGLVERRGESLDQGFQRLADATRNAALETASQLTDAAVNGCLDGVEQLDDTCVLAILRFG